MTDPVAPQAPTTKTRRAPRRWVAGAALAAAFVAGGLTVSGVAAFAQGGGMGMHGMMGGHEHMAMAHINMALNAVGASDAQKSKIEAILHDGFAPMMGAHHDMGETHKALMAILTAPTIDRAALERLRAEHVAKIDEASHGMATALADAAEVLTPEQRAKLAGLMAEHQPPS